jgi:hypothetical protein
VKPREEGATSNLHRPSPSEMHQHFSPLKRKSISFEETPRDEVQTESGESNHQSENEFPPILVAEATEFEPSDIIARAKRKKMYNTQHSSQPTQEGDEHSGCTKRAGNIYCVPHSQAAKGTNFHHCRKTECETQSDNDSEDDSTQPNERNPQSSALPNFMSQPTDQTQPKTKLSTENTSDQERCGLKLEYIVDEEDFDIQLYCQFDSSKK